LTSFERVEYQLATFGCIQIDIRFEAGINVFPRKPENRVNMVGPGYLTRFKVVFPAARAAKLLADVKQLVAPFNLGLGILQHAFALNLLGNLPDGNYQTLIFRFAA